MSPSHAQSLCAGSQRRVLPQQVVSEGEPVTAGRPDIVWKVPLCSVVLLSVPGAPADQPQQELWGLTESGARPGFAVLLSVRNSQQSECV